MSTKSSVGIIYSHKRKVFIKGHTDDQPSNIFWGLKELSDRGYPVSEFQPMPKDGKQSVSTADYFKWILANKATLNKLDYIVSYNRTCSLPLCLLKAIGIIKARIIVFHLGINLFTITNKLKLAYYKFEVGIYAKHAYKIAVRSNYEKDIYDKMTGVKPSKFWFARQGVNTSFYFPEEKDNKMLLIVGNNPNRDWNQVYKLAAGLPDMEVVVASHTFKGNADTVPPNLTIHKNLTLAETRKLFSKAGFLLLQTIPNTHLSGSTTMLAGLASGCVLLMDDLTALEDYYLKSGENMVGLERGSIDGVIKKIKSLKESPELVAKIQKNADGLSARLNINAMADDLEEIIRDNKSSL